MAQPKITKIETVIFAHEIQDMGTDYNGFNLVYEKGNILKSQSSVLRIHTDTGITGECTGRQLPANVANYVLGKNPFEREKIYNDLKRGLRHTDRTAISGLDVALWDFAGKAYNAPIYQMLGGWRECAELGYPAFKIHGWGNAPIQREVANIHAVGQRVGDRMDLMIDPACELETWADALKVGRACDEQNFFWLEDAYKDGGVSIFGHRKLRELIKTPLLQTEHIFGLEQHVDFIVNGGTDFVRTGTYEDGGITGVMKIAHAAEGFGLDVELHGGGIPHRHCIAAIRNTNYYELGLLNPLIKGTKPPIHPPEFTDELENIDANGHVPVPQGPGLGVEIDWDYINAHRVDTIVHE